MKVLATIPQEKMEAVEDSLFMCGEKGKDWYIRHIEYGSCIVWSCMNETLKEALHKHEIRYHIMSERN
jgi:hypothetical protein